MMHVSGCGKIKLIPCDIGHDYENKQIKAVVSAYGVKGMVFFPGDSDPECCDMRLYLSLDSFPEADDELFSFTENPYSI